MRIALWHITGMVLATALSVWGDDWNPRLAANYLDARQKDWAEWSVAKATGGSCFSCHTGMTYLLARPVLRQAAGEFAPTPYEKMALDGLRARVDKREGKEISHAFSKEPVASEAVGVEAIFSALFLVRADHGTLSPAAEQALDRMWSLQLHDGPSKGAWNWFQLNLDPWETTDSPFYGAALAAFAVASAPVSYRDRPEIKEHIAEMITYLRAARDGQPLHNRLMLLWSSRVIPDVFPESGRKKLIDEALSHQQPDGGWTLASLGPWKERPTAKPSEGSNAYATSMIAVSLEQGGLTAKNAHLAKALAWLRAKQNAAGYWDAYSMNKQYPAGSQQELFMRDAATGFAALALTNADSQN